MGFLEQAKPYAAMTSPQFGYAGMTIITKVSFNRGMNHFVLVVYRHAVATLALAPFVFMQIFLLGLLGPVIDQNFYYLGIKLTTPTFACALGNLLPVMTFLMALLFRMEKVDIRQARSLAKIAGTVICVGGAMLMTLYKGPVVPLLPHHSFVHRHHHNSTQTNYAQSSDMDWIKGSLLLCAATLAWSALFILQAHTLKKYPAPLSLTTLICFSGTLQAICITLGIVQGSSEWALHWDIDLLTAVYSVCILCPFMNEF